MPLACFCALFTGDQEKYLEIDAGFRVLLPLTHDRRVQLFVTAANRRLRVRVRSLFWCRGVSACVIGLVAFLFVR